MAVAAVPSSSRSAAGLSQGKLLDAAAAAAAAAKPYSTETSSMAMSTGVTNTTSSSFGGVVSEQPPVGCAPDAYKLFVGNIPKSLTEENLRPVSIVVVCLVICASLLLSKQSLVLPAIPGMFYSLLCGWAHCLSGMWWLTMCALSASCVPSLIHLILPSAVVRSV